MTHTCSPPASVIAQLVPCHLWHAVSDRYEMGLLLLHRSGLCTCNSCVKHALLSSTVDFASPKLSRKVLVAGYKYTEQGISSCAVNTSQPVGTVFAVTFVVFDLSIPSKSASVTRTIQIISPCDAGQVLCSDGTCSSVACKFR